MSCSTDEGYPLVIRPPGEHSNLALWTSSARDFVNAQLSIHGAILFRGFQVDSISAFEDAARAISPDLYGEYGDLPKEKNSERIYRSTPYPADKPILFHNEASHTHRWPLKQWFFCLIPSTSGGQTPIVDCRRIYERLDPKIVSRFKAKKLRYVRNFIPGMDVSWQSFFKTTHKADVEANCRANDIQYEWFDEDKLRIYQVGPGVAKHPKTGEMVFFNQIQLHHLSFLDPAMRALIESSFSPDQYPRHVCYGDGTPIEDSVAQEISRTYWDNAVSFTWEIGDVLMLDNMLTAHARKPFSGRRKIVVAMAEMTHSRDVEC